MNEIIQFYSQNLSTVCFGYRCKVNFKNESLLNEKVIKRIVSNDEDLICKAPDYFNDRYFKIKFDDHENNTNCYYALKHEYGNVLSEVAKTLNRHCNNGEYIINSNKIIYKGV